MPPIVEGFQIAVDVSFDPPIALSSVLNADANRTTSVIYGTYNPESESTLNEIVISDYLVFPGVNSSHALEIYGIGTDDVNILSEDYELRFTGVLDTIVKYNSVWSRNDTIIYVKSGGQMATIFSTLRDTSGLAYHPFNPDPGTASPFLVKIPFEIWNTDQNKQVNFMIRDRMQSGTENPFYSWNTEDRMYGVIVNSDYDENTVIPIQPNTLNELATWVLVFWSTHWADGDRVLLNYSAPVKPGIDKYTFMTSKRESSIPTSSTLYQNYPNPFNPATTIRFFLTQPGIVKLEVFDILGRRITQLVHNGFTAGMHEVIFDGSNFASGVYIYRLQASTIGNHGENFVTTKKLLLIK